MNNKTRLPDYTAPLPVRADGIEAIAALANFHFESGERLDSLTIGYTTHGSLNAARNNAILLMPGTANTRHSADGYIGPGQALDTDTHFIIASDAIGTGTSSRPSEGLRDAFPRYTVRDMVHAQHRLVTEALGLRSLKAVVGASMGAFQALEWAIHYPTTARAGVLMVPSVAAGNIFRTVVTSLIGIIKADPLWCDGRYTAPPHDGLRLAGQVYFPWTVADDFLQSLSPDELALEMGGTMERSASWDAWDLIRRYEASSGHNVAVPFNGDVGAALARVQIPLLIMPTTTDRLLGITGAQSIATHVARAVYAEIDSARGHLGWRPIPDSPEMDKISRQTRAFLEEIGS
jgi:homoserine O-acetyltransferase